MGKKEDKKSERQITDSGEIPLVFVNEGVGDDKGYLKVEPPVRKRSRGRSTVSMGSSKDEDQAQDAEKVK